GGRVSRRRSRRTGGRAPDSTGTSRPRWAGEAAAGRSRSEPGPAHRPSDRMPAGETRDRDTGRGVRATRRNDSPPSGRISIVTQLETDVQATWQEYRERPTVELRNRLVERYLSLV